jgi:hypothetical protein
MVPITADFMLDSLCLAAFSNTEETKALLELVLSVYKDIKKKNSDIVDVDLEVFVDIINDIVHSDVNLNKKAEINRIILKVKKSALAQKDATIVDSVINILNDSDGISETRIKQLTRKLNHWVAIAKSKSILTQALMKCNRYDPNDNATNDVLLSEILEYARTLSDIQNAVGGSSDIIDMVDLSSKSSVKKAYTAYKSKRNQHGFKTGLKGLNRMLGEMQRFLPGKFAAFAASSHNFKTGILLKCARWIVTKGVFEVPAGMIPTVVMISLENEVPDNSMEMIKEAYIDIYKEPIPQGINEDELIQKVCDYYAQKHVKLLIYRFDEEFGFSDFQKLQTQLKNRNHHVLATIIDYMALMKLEGDESDNPAKRLQKLANKLANFFKRNNQLGLTGIQLDTKADEINASGKTNVVKLYNSYHLADCKGVRRELDILIFMYIEHNQDGVPWLTFYWNKNRGEIEPPRKYKYCAYRFHPILGILEDEDTPHDMSVSDIYSVDLPDEEEASLFKDNLLNKQKVAEETEKKEEEVSEFVFE